MGFAISITEEILNLEPLVEKVEMLRKRASMSELEVMFAIRERLTFFAIYNLFDTVDLNRNDAQVTIQRLMIHIKNQDHQIDQLNRALSRLQVLDPILEDEGLVNKIIKKAKAKEIIMSSNGG